MENTYEYEIRVKENNPFFGSEKAYPLSDRYLVSDTVASLEGNEWVFRFSVHPQKTIEGEIVPPQVNYDRIQREFMTEERNSLLRKFCEAIGEIAESLSAGSSTLVELPGGFRYLLEKEYGGYTLAKVETFVEGEGDFEGVGFFETRNLRQGGWDSAVSITPYAPSGGMYSLKSLPVTGGRQRFWYSIDKEEGLKSMEPTCVC